MGALCIDVNGVKGLAGAHEQPVALASAEAEIGAGFRQHDLANPFAAEGEDVHAIVSLADPAGGGPDVAVPVGANAGAGADIRPVRSAGFAIANRNRAPANAPNSVASRNRRVEKPVSGRHPRCELKQFDAITEVAELADHSGGALLL